MRVGAERFSDGRSGDEALTLRVDGGLPPAAHQAGREAFHVVRRRAAPHGSARPHGRRAPDVRARPALRRQRQHGVHGIAELGLHRHLLADRVRPLDGKATGSSRATSRPSSTPGNGSGAGPACGCWRAGRRSATGAWQMKGVRSAACSITQRWSSSNAVLKTSRSCWLRKSRCCTEPLLTVTDVQVSSSSRPVLRQHLLADADCGRCRSPTASCDCRHSPRSARCPARRRRR